MGGSNAFEYETAPIRSLSQKWTMPGSKSEEESVWSNITMISQHAAFTLHEE